MCAGHELRGFSACCNKDGCPGVELRSQPEQIAIERSAQALIRADQDDGTLLHLPFFEQGMGEIAHVRSRFTLNAIQELYKRTAGKGPLLGFPQFRCRNHLHRPGDLRGVANGTDPTTQFAWTMHTSCSLC